MNIIFLDIDGVLNSMPYFESVIQKRIESNNEIIYFGDLRGKEI